MCVFVSSLFTLSDTILALLRKYDGDVEKTMNELLDASDERKHQSEVRFYWKKL
jgi:hypothetical protein